jgi:hypothetical protein
MKKSEVSDWRNPGEDAEPHPPAPSPDNWRRGAFCRIVIKMNITFDYLPVFFGDDLPLSSKLLMLQA